MCDEMVSFNSMRDGNGAKNDLFKKWQHIVFFITGILYLCAFKQTTTSRDKEQKTVREGALYCLHVTAHRSYDADDAGNSASSSQQRTALHER
jgi:hypothetical protein